MKNVLPFFATREDLNALTSALEVMRPLKCVEAGLFSDPTTVERSVRLSEITPNQTARYVVADASAILKAREVEQRSGKRMYAVDQLENPDTLVLTPGGASDERTLIAGQIGTGTESASSLSLFKAFEREVRKQFKKVRSYYVGPRAYALLTSGGRLTQNLRSPSEYDLKP